jgi:hypothetical protein
MIPVWRAKELVPSEAMMRAMAPTITWRKRNAYRRQRQSAAHHVKPTYLRDLLKGQIHLESRKMMMKCIQPGKKRA